MSNRYHIQFNAGTTNPAAQFVQTFHSNCEHSHPAIPKLIQPGLAEQVALSSPTTPCIVSYQLLLMGVLRLKGRWIGPCLQTIESKVKVCSIPLPEWFINISFPNVKEGMGASKWSTYMGASSMYTEKCHWVEKEMALSLLNKRVQ